MTAAPTTISYKRHRTTAFVGALLSFVLGFGLVQVGANIVVAGGVPPGFVGHEGVLGLLVVGLTICFIRSALIVVDHLFRRKVVFTETHVTIPPCRLWHLWSRRIRYQDIKQLALVPAPGANRNLIIQWKGGSRTLPGFAVGVPTLLASELKRRCPQASASF